MPRRSVLIAAIAAMIVSFIGASVQASVSGPPAWWGGHMINGGHMIWWGPDRGIDDPIAGARELAVSATEYSFTPAELSVAPGEPFNLTLLNEGLIGHDLVIPDLGVHISADPGRRATTGIVANETGTYDVVCTLPGHATAGMTARLQVQDN